MKIPFTLIVLAGVGLAASLEAAPASSGKSQKGKAASSSASSKKQSASKAESTSPKAVNEKSAVSAKDSETEGPGDSRIPRVAAVTSLETEALANFEHYAPQIQELIRKALDLTKLNLTYTFGSADPKNGGMDCSGTIYHLLKDFGFQGVPRQSDEMAGWVQDRTLLHRITSADALTDPEFAGLQPGDLLFWSGTYVTAPRKIPVTHVMLYLGKLKKNGRHVVFGASDGRMYAGERRTGVSVFDFTLPRSNSTAKFYGYGMIPGVGKIAVPTSPPPLVLATTAPVVKPSVPVTEKVKVEAAPLEKMSNSATPSKPQAQPPAVVAAPPIVSREVTAADTTAKKEIGVKVATNAQEEKPKSSATRPATEGDGGEEVRRAELPTIVTAKISQPEKPKATVKKTSNNTARKSTTASKTKSTPTSSSSSVRRREPAPITTQQKLENAMRKMGRSVRDTFSR